MIEASLCWNRRMASGNQAIDGIDWRPVIAEPIAFRKIATRATRRPTTLPSTMASR